MILYVLQCAFHRLHSVSNVQNGDEWTIEWTGHGRENKGMIAGSAACSRKEGRRS